MRKKNFSLLEVMIGLVLATLLLTTLFSTFRELMQTGAKLSKARQEKHWEYVLNMRLTQVFEAIGADALFTTEPYRDIAPQALHFIFNNGIDLDPKFCEKIDGFLFLNKDQQLCLVLQAKDGTSRKEVLVMNGKDYELKFFDPQSKKWIREWIQTSPPPIVQMAVCKKSFQFVLPHGNRMVQL